MSSWCCLIGNAAHGRLDPHQRAVRLACTIPSHKMQKHSLRQASAGAALASIKSKTQAHAPVFHIRTPPLNPPFNPQPLFLKALFSFTLKRVFLPPMKTRLWILQCHLLPLSFPHSFETARSGLFPEHCLPPCSGTLQYNQVSTSPIPPTLQPAPALSSLSPTPNHLENIAFPASLLLGLKEAGNGICVFIYTRGAHTCLSPLSPFRILFHCWSF